MGEGPLVWGHSMDYHQAPLFFLWSYAQYQEPRDRKEQTCHSASNSGKMSVYDGGSSGHILEQMGQALSPGLRIAVPCKYVRKVGQGGVKALRESREVGEGSVPWLTQRVKKWMVSSCRGPEKWRETL